MSDTIQAHVAEAEIVEAVPSATQLPAATVAAPALPAGADPMTMIERALSSGASVETLTQLMGLQERWQANQARRAFDQALASAKAEIGPITKNREVDFTGNTGKRTQYRFEDLAEIARTVDPALSKFGLSYRYKTRQEGQMLHVACVLSHRDGHSEEFPLAAPNDMSGNKNAIQSIASALTYLQRYTLKAALGLAVSNDDDGRAGGGGNDDKELTASQVKTLRLLIVETGTDEAKFFKHAKVECLEDVRPKDFQKLHSMLLAKKRLAASSGDSQVVEGEAA